METIETKLEVSQRLKKTQEDLDNFEEMMELVRKYPSESMPLPPPSPPYTLSEQYK